MFENTSEIGSENPINLVNNAVDKERDYRDFDVRMEQISNPDLKYVPAVESANVLAQRMDDPEDKPAVPGILVGMAKTRKMRPSEFIVLAAVVDDTMYGDGSKDLEGLNPAEKSSLDTVMSKDPQYSLDLVQEIKNESSKLGMEPSDMIRRYGVQKAKEAVANYDGGREKLKEETLHDITDSVPPEVNRIRRSSEKNQAEIRANIDKLQPTGSSKPAENYIPDIMTAANIQAEDTRVKLATSLGVDWNSLSDAQKTELRSMEPTDLYVALAKMSSEGKNAIDEFEGMEKELQQKMDELEAKHQQALNELNKNREEQEKRWQAEKDQRLKDIKDNFNKDMRDIDLERSVAADASQLYTGYLYGEGDRTARVGIKTGIEYMNANFRLNGSDAFRVIFAKNLAEKVYQANKGVINSADEALDRYVITPQLAEKTIDMSSVPAGVDKANKIESNRQVLLQVAKDPGKSIDNWVKFNSR